MREMKRDNGKSLMRENGRVMNVDERESVMRVMKRESWWENGWKKRKKEWNKRDWERENKKKRVDEREWKRVDKKEWMRKIWREMNRKKIKREIWWKRMKEC